jgi:hypothetical protein
MMVSGTVAAAEKSKYDFYMHNTGKVYSYVSGTSNKKKYLSDPWTLCVSKISCKGSYGISFCPVKGATKCTKSAVWINFVGKKSVKYATGDAAKLTYKLAARMDDDYYTSFSATGWFNADHVQN